MVVAGISVIRVGPHYGIYDTQHPLGVGTFHGFFQFEQAKKQFTACIQHGKDVHDEQNRSEGR